MPSDILNCLQQHRERTFNILHGKQLKSAEDAVRFVNQNGFVFFWPIKGVILPSLWVATAGNRPLPNNHDDPGHITWDWKDKLLSKKLWYYGRVLRRRNTIISLASLPYFYALSPNYGDPENDYIEQYAMGTITREAKMVYEALLKEGPLDSLALRRAAQMSNASSSGRFNKALDDLQGEMKVLPVGISPVGTWRYAFIYDIVTRHFPGLQMEARPISDQDARLFLARQYFEMAGAAKIEEVSRLFHWRKEDTNRIVNKLMESGEINAINTMPDLPGAYLVLKSLIG